MMARCLTKPDAFINIITILSQKSFVNPNSPASRSGLKNDDYIIEVCDLNVESMEFASLIEFINVKYLQNDLKLLVVDQNTYGYYKKRKLPILLTSKTDSISKNNEDLNHNSECNFFSIFLVKFYFKLFRFHI